MSYVLPPNNNIRIIASQDQPEELRQQLFDTDIKLQLADYRNTPEGGGPVKGWGGGSRATLAR